jgi:integrase
LPEGLQRKANGRYYLRYRIPKDLVPRLGWAEISWALGTSDPKEARRMLPQQVANLLNEFDAVRAGANPATLPLLSRKRAVVSGGDFVVPKKQLPTISDAEFEQILDRQTYDEEQIADDMRRQYEEEELEAKLRLAPTKLWEDMSDAEKTLHMILSERSEYRQLAEGRARDLAVLGRSAEGAKPSAATRPSVAETGSKVVMEGTSFDALVDRWAGERRPDAKTIDAHRAVARWFGERMGAMPIEAIEKRHIIQFKDKLLEEEQSLANIKVKITRIRTLLNYAADNDVIAVNPAATVKIIVPDDADRKPFDLPALRALFDSPVYSRDHRPTAGRGEAAYWLPILGLYTGARLEELGQLRPEDVRLETYPDEDDNDQSAWIIRITEDVAAGLKLKNAGSRRLIPVHPALEELGFIKLVLDAQASGQKRIFSELRPNKYGRLTAKWGEWFSAYKRTDAGIADRGMVFHSFRHTFKDHARSRMPDGVQRRIMGHSGVGMDKEYGDGHFTWALVDGMRQYKVAGLTLPRPPPKYR